MAYFYTRKDSPFVYISYRDEITRERKTFASKIRKDSKGWQKQVNSLVRKIEYEQDENMLASRFGFNNKKSPKLSEGLALYYNFKVSIKENTKKIYDRAVDYFIECNGDSPVNMYSQNSFGKFINHLKTKEASVESQALYLRHLKALFQYFYTEGFIHKNLVPRMNPPKKPVGAISPKDMKAILEHFKAKAGGRLRKQDHLQQYHLVRFLLLTGMRISSALVQTWENVLWEKGVMKVINVKASNREYFFPLHSSLTQLLVDMGAKRNGRLFNYSLHRSPAFWKREISVLFEKNKISSKYTLHHIRKTFGTTVRRSGSDLSMVKDLLNHSNIKVTSDHYSEDMSSTLYKKTLDEIKFGE